jgi:glycosyltransferase involved in cell wall biosynthesis
MKKNPILRIVLTDLYEYDAVGNFARGVAAWAGARGIPCAVHAERHSPSLTVDGDFADFFRQVGPEDVLLYHLPHEDPELARLLAAPCRRVAYYHNITPGHFFALYDPDLAAMLDRGRASLPLLAGADAVFANSAWSLAEVLPHLRGGAISGVMPPLTPERLNRLEAGPATAPADSPRPYLLTVGRLAPHKNIAGGLRLFAALHRRLPALHYVILGGESGIAGYLKEVRALAAGLGEAAAQIHFTGHVDDAEAAAWFRNAAGLLCCSRHEGFGVPLVEAMACGVPVMALDQPAVRETLGRAGLLLAGADVEDDAGRVAGLLLDAAGLAEVVERQRARLAELRAAVEENSFWAAITPEGAPG